MEQHILLVEDHTAFRQTLTLVFDREPEFEVVAQAGTVAEARETLNELEDGVDAAVALVLSGSLDRKDYAHGRLDYHGG